MPEIAHTAHDMIAGMTPELRGGLFVFATEVGAQATALLRDAIATFQEAEGVSMILPVDVAQSAGQAVDVPMRCITLNVYSSLEGYGLTAAVATVLAEAKIACNMVAAYHHDHAFVPADQAEDALTVLKALQDRTIRA